MELTSQAEGRGSAPGHFPTSSSDTLWGTFRGPVLMLLSAFLFAVLWLMIKLLGPRFGVWDVAVYRFGGGAVALSLLFGWRENLFRPANPRLIIFRGVVGSIAFLTLVLAIRRLPFSTTMVIFYSFPAFSAFFSPLLFGDRIRRGEVACILVSVIGVGVLFDFHPGGSLLGQAMAVASAIFAGLTISTIKTLRATHGSVVIYFYLCLVGFALSIFPFLVHPTIPRGMIEWSLIGSIMAVSIAAQLLMNQGFRYCKSWEGGLFMTSELIFSTLFGILLLGEGMTGRFILGGLLIFSSAAAMNLLQRRRTRPFSVPG